MSADLILREPLGERVVGAAEFPLSLGGDGAQVILPGPGGVQAWLAQHDGQLFVQPAGADSNVLHNGARIAGSAWLRSGDVLDVGGGRLKLRLDDGRRVLEVVAGGAGNVTAPPAVEAAAAIAGTGLDEDERIEPVAFRGPVEAELEAERHWPWRRVGIAVSLAALAAVAAVVLTSVPVQVEIDPAPQQMRFAGGWPGLRMGENHLLRPGAYTLEAEHEGYEPLRVAVEISKERNQRLAYTLAPLPGRLEIVLPVPGQVVIDGRAAGEAPGVFELPAGKHALAIDTERYLDFSTEVEIEGLGRTQKLEPQLTPAWGVVSISSVPGDAEVRVGGESRGRTPLQLELLAGSYRVELRREGFKPWISDVQVQANQPLTLGPVQLGLPDGRLVVRSLPAGANVTVGGAYRGRTPLEIDVRPGIAQAVSVLRDGYEAAEREVTIAAGGREVAEFKLVPILGEVIVRARPADAQLFVDGAARGAASQTLSLPATAHVIEIRRSGYAPHKVTVTPRKGLPQKIDVTLLEGVSRETGMAAVPEPAASASGALPQQAPAPAIVGLTPTVRTKTGQELKLVPAGEYTMGSPRREAGRRAARGRAPGQRGAASGPARAALLPVAARGHECGVPSVPAVAPLRLHPAEHPRVGSAARGQRQLAGCRGLRKLAEPAGRPRSGLRAAGRPAGAGRAGHERLPDADRGGMGVGRALVRRCRAAQVSVGRHVARAARSGQFRRSQGAAPGGAGARRLRRRPRGHRARRQLRGQPPRVPRHGRQRRGVDARPLHCATARHGRRRGSRGRRRRHSARDPRLELAAFRRDGAAGCLSRLRGRQAQ